MRSSAILDTTIFLSLALWSCGERGQKHEVSEHAITSEQDQQESSASHEANSENSLDLASQVRKFPDIGVGGSSMPKLPDIVGGSSMPKLPDIVGGSDPSASQSAQYFESFAGLWETRAMRGLELSDSEIQNPTMEKLKAVRQIAVGANFGSVAKQSMSEFTKKIKFTKVPQPKPKLGSRSERMVNDLPPTPRLWATYFNRRCEESFLRLKSVINGFNSISSNLPRPLFKEDACNLERLSEIERSCDVRPLGFLIQEQKPEQRKTDKYSPYNPYGYLNKVQEEYLGAVYLEPAALAFHELGVEEFPTTADLFEMKAQNISKAVSYVTGKGKTKKFVKLIPVWGAPAAYAQNAQCSDAIVRWTMPMLAKTGRYLRPILFPKD